MSSKPSYYLFTKWTKGETVERSVRSKPVSSKEQQGERCSEQVAEHHQEDYGNANINGDSGGEMGCGGQMYSAIDQTASGFTRQANKRDSFNEMLSGRDMHTQVGQNPFLAGESYLNHLKIQEDFLRPQNTAAMEPKKES